MKSASKGLYIVGRIFNIVAMVFSFLLGVLGVIFLVLKADIAAQAAADNIAAFNDEKKVEIFGVFVLVTAIIYLIVQLVVYILATRANKKLNEGSKDTTPHIIMLIIGIFGDIFYFLGGIFGLIAVNQDKE